MLTVLVSILVKPDHIQAFTDATIQDTRATLRDPGVVRFDFLQQSDDPAHFILHEVYQSREDGMHHLETAHFKAWQNTIKPLLVQPPQAVTYEHVFPRD